MLITRGHKKSNDLNTVRIILVSALLLHVILFSTDEIVDVKLFSPPVSKSNADQDPKISLVLSYCRGSIDWLEDFALGVSFHSATFVSKCGTTAKVPVGFATTRLHEISLPNVGRNDHTFAYALSRLANDNSYKDNEIVLLLKDNLNIQANYQGRRLPEMISVASERDFSCLQQATLGNSRFHDTETLLRYSVAFYAGKFKSASGEVIPNNSSNFKSRFANLGSWLASIGNELPTPYAEVCYGGNFAVKLGRARMLQKELKAIQSSLLRGDNIEEGHFAERVWAGLFAQPLTSHEQLQLKETSKIIKTKMRRGGGGELGKIKFQNIGDLAHLYQ